MNKKWKKIIGLTVIATGVAFVGALFASGKKKPGSLYDNDQKQKNPLEGKKVVFILDENDIENADGVKGHLEAVGDNDYKPSLYDHVKRGLDIVLSFGGLVVLSPILVGTAIAIKIDDPGPVLFTQKRLGQNKQYFKLHKFRTMKMSTPHDVPTHMLDNPEQYITKVGKFLRAHSLDELPQIWDIFVGNMSVIGPRPGLWNQDLLIAERDKYGANDVKPGLTGWAQINGRDELEIPDKARLDGEYVAKKGLMMDIKCFFGSLHVFGADRSVVEGGTGEMKKHDVHNEKLNIWTFVDYNMLPEHGALNRHFNIGKAMTERGHKITVFVGSHPHNTNLQLIEGKEKFKVYQTDPFPWILVKTLNYAEDKKKRIASMFLYYENAKAAVKRMEKPDVIIGSSAHPLCALLAINLAKKYGVKSIVEIRDLWPESIVTLGVAKADNPLIKMLYKMEHKLYTDADAVVFTFEGAYDYIKKQGWEREVPRNKVFYINNGIFVNEFDRSVEQNILDDEDLNSENFIVTYTGSVKLANALDSLLDCAKQLIDYKDIVFLVFGDGDYREKLEKCCIEEGITNIKFKGRVDKKYIPYILSKSCLNILNYNKEATESGLYQYGSSQNKLFEYFASGKPVISNAKIGYDLIDKYRCGIAEDLWDTDKYIEALLRIYNMSEKEYGELCTKARQAAYDFDFGKHAETLERICQKIMTE